MSDKQEYRSTIWEEDAEIDNPFAAKSNYCHGYNVYEDILPHAGWFDYIYVLFKGEKPTANQAILFEKLAIAIANPGPKDSSIRAAMNGGVGGSTHASSLIAALAVGAGQYGGSHEVHIVMQLWQTCGYDLEKWRLKLQDPVDDKRADVWLPMEHAPGFDPNIPNCPTTIKTMLSYLSSKSDGEALPWLLDNRLALEESVGYSLATSGVAAAALVDLGFDLHQATMLYLILRLPGAAAHALEQRKRKWNEFPFFGDAIELADDPGFKGIPDMEALLCHWKI